MFFGCPNGFCILFDEPKSMSVKYPSGATETFPEREKISFWLLFQQNKKEVVEQPGTDVHEKIFDK
jgi:hypothetical protein